MTKTTSLEKVSDKKATKRGIKFAQFFAKLNPFFDNDATSASKKLRQSITDFLDHRIDEVTLKSAFFIDGISQRINLDSVGFLERFRVNGKLYSLATNNSSGIFLEAIFDLNILMSPKIKRDLDLEWELRYPESIAGFGVYSFIYIVSKFYFEELLEKDRYLCILALSFINSRSCINCLDKLRKFRSKNETETLFLESANKAYIDSLENLEAYEKVLEISRSFPKYYHKGMPL